MEGMTLEKLQVIIEAYTKPFQDELKKVQAQTKQTSAIVEKQTSKISSAFKKIGSVVAVALSVTALVRFGSSCLELGSNLNEVQNIVDVTFTSMNESVNNFAKNSITQFGLSETAAKKYVGMYGTMAKQFGFTEQAAYDMSTGLAGMAGDVSSFYNMTADEAYTKLKSVFSGETETLKDIGVVMTQNALDAYALANGFGKTTAQMSEQEKVALRYQFVMKQLSAANGDFTRTSGSWANQTRVLSLQFQSFKAAIGQGLINVFTPIIKVINTVMAKLVALANTFKNFTALITGTKSTAGSTSNLASDLTSAADSSSNMADSAADTAASTKEAQKALMGFDEVNSIGADTSSSGAGTNGIDVGGLGLDGFTSDLDTANESSSKLYDTFLKLKQLFLDGFSVGLGDTSVFDSIQNHLTGIKESIKNIISDSDVVASASGFVDKFVYSVGQRVGALTSIGATIADNITGGIDKFLQQDSGRIKSFIVSMFDIGGSISEIKGNFSVALADIFSVFRGDTAKQITADIISTFADASMGAIELGSKLYRDLLNLITKPFIDNKDQIKTALGGTLEVISNAVGTIKELVQNTADKANAVYDAHIKPMMDAITEGISSLTGSFLDFYNDSVKPVLDKLAEKFKTVVESHVQPAIDKFLELFGKVADMITVLWQNVISPFIQWVISTILPLLLPVIESIGNTFLDVMANISDAIGGVITVISGIVDFITGVFAGDWELAWEGVKEIFSGFGNVIAGLASATWNAIKLPFSVTITFFGNLFSLAWEAIKNAWSLVTTWFQSVWDSITNIFINVGTWFKDKFDSAWTLIKNIFSISNISTWFTARWSDIKNIFSTVDSWFKEKFDNAWSRIKEIFSLSNVSTWFTARWNDIKNIFNTVDTWFKDKFNSAWEFIKSIFSLSNLTNWFKERYANVTTAFDSADSWFDNKFGDAWTKIKGVFSQSSLTGWFGDRWSDIKNGFAVVDSWFGGKFGDAWGEIKKVFSTSTLKSFFGDDGVWGTIKGLFTNIGTKVGDAVGGAFKSAINTALQTVENAINTAIGVINTVIGAINKVNPLGDIKGVSPVSFGGLKLAKGGVVNSATIAMIGEAGKEAVVPLENNTGWMEKIGNLIGNIVSTNISMQLATVGDYSSTPIHVTVDLDGRTIATAVAVANNRNGINFKE